MRSRRDDDGKATARAVPDIVSVDAPPRRSARPTSALPLPDAAQLRKSTAPDSTAPALSLPVVTAPDSTTPDIAMPDLTASEITAPISTTPEVVAHVGTTPDTRKPGGTTPGGTPPTNHPSVLLIVSAVIVTILAIGVVAYATTESRRNNDGAAPQSPVQSSVRPTSTPTFPLSAGQLNQRAALAWMATNLPRNAALLTDPTVSGRLISLGFTTVLTTPAASPPRYVVSDQALRANGVYGAVLARSVPVARFGADSSVVEVRSVLTVTAKRVAAVLAADLANRRLAGAALVRNPRLGLSAGARTVVRKGDLDLRAATYLALVAADTRVQVTALPIDAAEAAASRPRRVVTLAATGRAAGAVRAAAAGLPPAYAPATVDATTPGSLTLTWSANAQPVEPVS